MICLYWVGAEFHCVLVFSCHDYDWVFACGNWFSVHWCQLWLVSVSLAAAQHNIMWPINCYDCSSLYNLWLPWHTVINTPQHQTINIIQWLWKIKYFIQNILINQNLNYSRDNLTLSRPTSGAGSQIQSTSMPLISIFCVSFRYVQSPNTIGLIDLWLSLTPFTAISCFGHDHRNTKSYILRLCIYGW